MFESYLPVFLMLIVSASLALLFFCLTSVFGPKNPTLEKQIPYESGSESVGSNQVRLSVKFYLTAILFVVFDIEAIFLYPWASLFRELGVLGLIEMMSFLSILSLSLLYAYKKGALQWVK